MQLRCCRQCGLYFRLPKDTSEWNERYYSKHYRSSDYVTELPRDDELDTLLDSSFEGTRHNFSRYIHWLRGLRPSGRLFDFGSSWGYGAWQFDQAGYKVMGYEIDPQRARFGRERLGLQIVSPPRGLSDLDAGSFDIVFTAHTLEHLPSPAGVLGQFRRLLIPGGWLIVVVPNCTGFEESWILEEKRPWAYGRTHSLAYDAAFFKNNLPSHGFELKTITTKLDSYASHSSGLDPLDAELLIVAKRTEVV